MAEPAVGVSVSVDDKAPSAMAAAAAIADLAEENVSTSTSAAADGSGVEPTGGSSIVIAFSAPCWVDIRDSSNRFKLYGEMAGGRTETLGGEPPYRLIIGNANAASIRVGGQPYDLAPHTSGNVARLTLSPN